MAEEHDEPAPAPFADAAGDPTLPPSRAAIDTRLLLLSVLVVATCGLVYELITATMASYLLGDTVTQFSLVIGVYLSAMGVGSWLSKSINKRLHDRFITIQLIIAVIGGFSAAALFLGFAQLSTIRPLLFGILIVIGTMVGLEIPLLMRIMQHGRPQALKDVVARVLAFDYIGSLLASLLFPLALLPYLGLVRTSLLFGLFNALIATWAAFAFAKHLRRPALVRIEAMAVAALIGSSLFLGGRIEEFGERQLYDNPVIFSKKTPYQRLTITRWSDDIRLYIDGNLQFSSVDEHRYHESLVHPAMSTAKTRERVLILGGGDGFAAREVLKYDDVASIDLVDLDPTMTALFSENPMLADLNGDALEDERLTVHNADAMHWLEAQRQDGADAYDVIVIDLPDPNNFSLGKLYSRSFYRLVAATLHPDGAAVVQSTSPYLAPRSFWCVMKTIESAELSVQPYHAHVPSFGDWGFGLVTRSDAPVPAELSDDIELRFLTDELVPTLFAFPADQARMDVEINRLNDQRLVHYYEQDLQTLGPAPKS
jgi:spermidine synthase